jgi:hypothetical protein
MHRRVELWRRPEVLRVVLRRCDDERPEALEGRDLRDERRPGVPAERLHEHELDGLPVDPLNRCNHLQIKTVHRRHLLPECSHLIRVRLKRFENVAKNRAGDLRPIAHKP